MSAVRPLVSTIKRSFHSSRNVRASALNIHSGGGRSSTSGIVATVFGGSGLMGRYVVSLLGRIGSQVIVPYRGTGENVRHLKVMGELGQIVPIPFDFYDVESIQRAVSRSNVIINLVGIQHETRNWSFHDTHVKAVHRLAKIAKEAGVKRFINISTLGADVNSKSQWIASKAEGELAVQEFFPNATILRSGHIFGEEDSFLTRIAEMALNFPIIPLVGGGGQRLQPVFAGDVAQAVLNAITLSSTEGKTYHLGGPELYSYAGLVDYVRRTIYLHNTMSNLKPSVAETLAWVVEHLPANYRLINRDLIKQFDIDMVVPTTPGTLTLADLRVEPQEMAQRAPGILNRFRGTRGPSRFGTDDLETHRWDLFGTPEVDQLGVFKNPKY